MDREAKEFEGTRRVMIEERSNAAGCEREINALLGEAQMLREEMRHRELAEQHTLEEGARIVHRLEAEIPSLNAELDEAQVEMSHLRVILHKYDKESQMEQERMEHLHNQQVAELSHTIQ